MSSLSRVCRRPRQLDPQCDRAAGAAVLHLDAAPSRAATRNVEHQVAFLGDPATRELGRRRRHRLGQRHAGDTKRRDHRGGERDCAHERPPARQQPSTDAVRGRGGSRTHCMPPGVACGAAGHRARGRMAAAALRALSRSAAAPLGISAAHDGVRPGADSHSDRGIRTTMAWRPSGGRTHGRRRRDRRRPHGAAGRAGERGRGAGRAPACSCKAWSGSRCWWSP